MLQANNVPANVCMNALSGLGESWPWFDEDEFRSEAVQRVWQYLRLYNADPSLIKEFYFEAHRSEGSPEECLATLIRFDIYIFLLVFTTRPSNGC